MFATYNKPIHVNHAVVAGDMLYHQNLWMWPSGGGSLMYIPGKTIVIGDAADIATYIHASYAHVNTAMGYGAKGNLLRDLHRLHPDIDTVLFTSHRDGSNAAGCVSELVAISGTWKPFSCPAHPRLRRNGGPCTCKIPQAIKCRGFKGCTPAWMNSHKYVC